MAGAGAEALRGPRQAGGANGGVDPAGQEVPWSVMAAVLVLARLSEPSSELHIAEDWYRTTGNVGVARDGRPRHSRMARVASGG